MKVKTVSERTTAQYSCTLHDQADQVVASLTALTLSLIDVATKQVINNRNAQDVLNANNVTFSNGVITWTLQPADNVLVTPSVASEVHKAIFHATWEGGELTWTQDIHVPNVPTIGA